MTENELSKIILDLGIKIHKVLGPGLLESAYEECLYYEIKKYGLSYLKLSNCKLGLLLNFNTVLFKNGIRRVVNNL
ncbi:MAG: GxxExxY protein [Bacteroidales bacterium]|jgi:hypothetical protein|nr:GxxExxY protein [Bacteroidales bacterium]